MQILLNFGRLDKKLRNESNVLITKPLQLMNWKRCALLMPLNSYLNLRILCNRSSLGFNGNCFQKYSRRVPCKCSQFNDSKVVWTAGTISTFRLWFIFECDNTLLTACKFALYFSSYLNCGKKNFRWLIIRPQLRLRARKCRDHNFSNANLCLSLHSSSN